MRLLLVEDDTEVANYYKEDARIWTIYLTFRRLDRWIHRLLGIPYPYVLPGPVDRWLVLKFAGYNSILSLRHLKDPPEWYPFR